MWDLVGGILERDVSLMFGVGTSSEVVSALGLLKVDVKGTC